MFLNSLLCCGDVRKGGGSESIPTSLKPASLDMSAEDAVDALSEGLYMHSLGRNETALKKLEEACRGFDAVLTNLKRKERIVDRPLYKLFEQTLNRYELIAKKKEVLDLSEKVEYISGLVGDLRFDPWVSDPLEDDFGSHGFEDPAGMPRLSSTQQKEFSGWMRPIGALGGQDFSENGAEAIYQDSLQDCSVVASLLSIIFWQKRSGKNLLHERLYPRNRPSSSGKYVLKLRFNGCERRVVIDDFLPAFADKSKSLFVQSSSNPQLVWPALFEKAYMKIMGGYDFEGSHAARDTYLFCGWIPEYIYLKGPYSEDTDHRKLWKRLYNGWNNGDLMVCLGMGNLTPGEASALGFISDHDYTVVDLKESDGQKLILVRNPWKEGDSSEDKVPLAAVEGLDAGAHGSFWLNFETACLWFQSIYLNWNPLMFSHRQTTNFLWGMDSIHMSQAIKGSFLTNPQFYIRNPSAKRNVATLLLTLHHAGRAKKTEGYFWLAAYETSTEDHSLRVNESDESPVVIQGASMNTTYNTIKLSLPPHTAYTVVVLGSDVISQLATLRFSLDVYALLPVEFGKTKEYKFSSTQKGLWNSDDSGGSFSLATYTKNPQFSLEVGPSTRAAEVRLYLISESRSALNIQLFWGDGRQIRTFDDKKVIASSGKYRVHTCFAKARQLHPGSYTIIISSFHPSPGSDYALYSFSATTKVKITPVISDTAGLYRRMLQVNWDGENKRLVSVHLPRPSAKTIVHVYAVIGATSTDLSPISSYRPHLRVSLLQDDAIISTTSTFSGSINGVYLDISRLGAGEYKLLAERMEAGRGQFEIEVFTTCPVNFI